MLVERYEVDEKRLSAAPRSSSSESDHSTKVIAADVVVVRPVGEDDDGCCQLWGVLTSSP
jgi:hypothetical protein